MFNTVEKFGYTIDKMGAGDELPFKPVLHITLIDWTCDKGDNTPIITANLLTEDDIDYHIKALKNDLDAVGVKAKAALAMAKAETRAIVSPKM
jgi:hypothetical protein